MVIDCQVCFLLRLSGVVYAFQGHVVTDCQVCFLLSKSCGD